MNKNDQLMLRITNYLLSINFYQCNNYDFVGRKRIFYLTYMI